jgi:ATP-dependent Lon protease
LAELVDPGKALPVLPLRKDILLPGIWAPVLVSSPSSIAAVEAAAATEEKVLLLGFQRDPALDEPKLSDLLDLGVVAVLRRLERSKDIVQVIVQVDSRARFETAEQEQPFLRVHFREVPLAAGAGAELDGRQRAVVEQARALDEFRDGRQVPLFGPMLEQVTEPVNQLYAIAALLEADRARSEAVLRASTRAELLEIVGEAVRYEAQVTKVKNEVESQAGAQITKQMRERMLREQLEAIRRELGDSSPEQSEVAELRRRFDEIALPDDVRKEASRTLERLERMSAMAPDFQIARAHLELILELPWQKSSPDHIDLELARRVLDEDHFGLEDVKDRIIEHLAVMKLNPGARAPILCLVGPPGVGKTSLGKSVARAIGRQFERLSLGGLHDESELRGHRRTYIGAMPGRLLQAVRRAGVNNPLLMLDEIDKLGRDFRGDPAAALLEILDPAQNSTFRDNYLDMPFDLSRVFFITTANALDPIPRPLLDRMEVLSLSGYSAQEKREIARRYLIPRQLHQAGVDSGMLVIPDATIDAVARRYTREAGVRDLERNLGRIVRKVAVQIVRGNLQPRNVQPEDLSELLGGPGIPDDLVRTEVQPGVATGLAWTEAGGDVLYVEAVLLPNGGSQLVMTGQLGKVMQESAQAARSYIVSRAEELGIDPVLAEKSGVHVHVPAGAIPKDGPSAGVTLATALASLYSNRPVRTDTAMTGELTLSGLVLPVGGIREKVLAAHRAGLKRVILPRANEPDLAKLPAELRSSLEFIPASRIEDVLTAALGDAGDTVQRHSTV